MIYLFDWFVERTLTIAHNRHKLKIIHILNVLFLKIFSHTPIQYVLDEYLLKNLVNGQINIIQKLKSSLLLVLEIVL